MIRLDFVRTLLSAAPSGEGVAPVASLGELRTHVAALAAPHTVERAALGGRASANLAWAFACGYTAALRRLLPALGDALAALCATEEGGPHPRAIRTTLTARAEGGWELSGDKTFVTLGADADQLIVVARTGTDDHDRPRLRAVCIPSTRAGITFAPCPPLPFATEIAHAGVALRAVAVSDEELLPGDGYDDVLKPFRTIEDTHVVAAAVGFGVRVARASGWPAPWTERAVACLVTLRAIGDAPPLEPETHLALAGALASARALLDEGSWALAPDAVRQGWERDRRLLDVARTAREARLAAAWRGLLPRT